MVSALRAGWKENPFLFFLFRRVAIATRGYQFAYSLADIKAGQAFPSP